MADAIVRFDRVSFEYGSQKPIIREGSFSVRRGAKFTVMGQNGAGKSTLFQLITGALKPDEGAINIPKGLAIATARQVIPREEMPLTVREFFERCFAKKIYDIDPKIDEALEIVNLHAPHDRIIRSFSGGQQARLLLASALIQQPDVLLLDEPTNNLDRAGIEHLTRFLIGYKKTCIVISHDADFLNAFTDGVLYLDVFTKKIEQYAGDYFDVVAQITARIEKENRKNAQLAKEIQEKKDKANVFAHKGGQMRMVAKRMREKAAELEEEKVDVRMEDKTIRPFRIPHQPDLVGEIAAISSLSVMKNHKPVARTVDILLKRNMHLLLSGPNGIGKSTLLETIAGGMAKGVSIAPGVRIGYCRQDFSTLNFEDTVHDALMGVMEHAAEQEMRSSAAGFLITGDMMRMKIGMLSEGQKGLVAFARLVLQKPGLLILDEPTNHINFRHIPVIARALDSYQGAMILVSHMRDFVAHVRIDQVLDLEK
ncbi:MAG: hypothetical protein A2679_03830 [Candidatus Sungbacteria bacterium RIFCSPHIGHO2_01_FULL_54_26]|nr:MAG: hypothetical protein A2679_03830 [Candidatus Sungbacteria bacterium RIFCSPHIGHO2_01_FULL_54_26]